MLSAELGVAFGCIAVLAPLAKGHCICAKSRLVSTSTKASGDSTSGAGRSRGVRGGGVCVANLACAALTFSASDCTHCKPALAARAAKSVTGRGAMGAGAADAIGAAIGAGTGSGIALEIATFSVVACA